MNKRIVAGVKKIAAGGVMFFWGFYMVNPKLGTMMPSFQYLNEKDCQIAQSELVSLLPPGWGQAEGQESEAFITACESSK
jgi:hypothetical protein